MSDDEFEPKLIYLVKRNASLSRPAFTKRWRRHGQLGMSLPRWRNIARYVHCDAFQPATDTPLVSTDYDGVGLIWHRSRAARAAHVADASSRAVMERDEFETFSEPIVRSSLIARETIVKSRADGQNTTRKWIVFLPSAREGDRIVDQLNEAGIALLGYSVNHALPAEQTSGWGLKAGCVEEWWFEDERAALAATAIIASDLRPHQTVMVLTNEVILFPPATDVE